jgi:hypothetical protein
MTVLVECYSGDRYAQRPVAVHWQGRRLEIRKVVHSWRTPYGLGFDVIVADSSRLQLLYDEEIDVWRVVDATALGSDIE